MELADQLFECPEPAYGNLRLLPQACAANWKKGKNSAPWDRLFSCKGCAIGAAHAGETPPDSEDDPRKCVYCGRTYLRLVSRALCISCSNRVNEYLSGHYRRTNTPPGLAAKLRHFVIVIAEDESCV